MPRMRRRADNDSDTSIDNNPVAGMEGYSSGFLEIQTDDGGPRDRPRVDEKKSKARKTKDGTSGRVKVRRGSKTKVRRPSGEDLEDITVSMSLRDESPNRVQPVPRDDADRYYLRSPAPRGPKTKAPKERQEPKARAVVPAVRLSHAGQTFHSDPNLTTAPDSSPHVIPHLSPWLSEQLASGADRKRGEAKAKKRNTVTDTGELDRHRDEEVRQLQDRIDDLVCEGKLKDRELETNRWIEKEMERKLMDADDAFQVKAQLRETERQLDCLTQINRDLKDENKRIQHDLVNKERHVLELQTEVDNLDKVISVKSALRESDTIQELQERLDRAQVDLDRSVHDANAKDRQVAYYQAEVEKRDREMQHKNRRIDDLQMETEELREETAQKNRQLSGILEKMKAMEREEQALREELRKGDELRVKLQNSQDEISALRERIRQLEAELESLRRQSENHQELQNVVDDLRRVVGENNLAEKERQQMAEQLRRTESLLKERAAEEEGERRANEQLRNFCSELERENKFLREAEKEQRAARQQRDQSVRARAEAERREDETRSRLAELQEKCREKDGIIKRLADELRARGDFLPPSLSPKGLPALVEVRDEVRGFESARSVRMTDIQQESMPRQFEDNLVPRMTVTTDALTPRGESWPSPGPMESAMPRDELAELVRLNARSPREREALPRKVTPRR